MSLIGRDVLTMQQTKHLPDCRHERVIDLLKEFAASPSDYDVYKVAEELRHLFAEQSAEAHRKEIACAGGY